MHPATTNLNSKDFATLLKNMNACRKTRKWAKGKDLVTFWTTCHQGDWMFFLLYFATPLDPITNELLACRFAREVQHLNPDPRVLACIETREAWARGEVSDEVRDAARDAAWDAATDAARFPAWAAAWAASQSAAWTSARAAAEAAARYPAWAAAWDATLASARAKQADIIRELVSMPVLTAFV